MISEQLIRGFPILLGLVLLLALACAAPAATPTPDPVAQPTPGTGAGDPPQPTPTPMAQPTPTPGPPAAVQPAGTLNVGLKEMGLFSAHPRLTGTPQTHMVSLTIGEGMVGIDQSWTTIPLLAIAWGISEDFTTWTFNLPQGVQFHKGYGEMTADDVLYSFQQFGESDVHVRASSIHAFFGHSQGYTEIPDPYTLVVNTGDPIPDIAAFNFLQGVHGSGTWVVSKKQSEELGAEAAGRDTASTGPWEIVEHRTAQFWQFRAVEGHWRQTPHFAELILWEIPEESARLAGFQTGHLDTFTMTFDSISLVESVPGARLQILPSAGEAGLNFYGQVYPGPDMPADNPGYNPDLAWVSGDSNPASDEWKQAVKVRQALSVAIDRQAIVDTLLHGFGTPTVMRDWAGHEHRMPAHWEVEYNPERARELLSEAGYPNGFRITLTPSIREAPAELEACQAIAAMWGEIGIDVQLQRVPYTTLRPSLVARTYHGATCQAVPPRLDPVTGLPSYSRDSVFSFGTEHPWLEERILLAVAEVDPVRRDQTTLEAYDFLFQNALGAIGLYSFNTIWPVGPRIEQWEPTSYGELRVPSGFEHIRHRQQ